MSEVTSKGWEKTNIIKLGLSKCCSHLHTIMFEDWIAVAKYQEKYVAIDTIIDDKI